MICYTYGVFDLFHYGHLRALKRARELGDKLVIGVFTDEVAESFKRKPIMNENERFQILHELGMGSVMLQRSLDPTENLKKCKADIVAKAPGAGWEEDNIPQYEGVKSVLLHYTKGISTTDIINRLCGSK